MEGEHVFGGGGAGEGDSGPGEARDVVYAKVVTGIQLSALERTLLRSHLHNVTTWFSGVDENDIDRELDVVPGEVGYSAL